MNAITLFGGNLQPDRELARQTNQALQVLDARTEIAQAQAQGQAMVTLTYMTLGTNMTAYAEQLAKQTPAAAPFLGMALQAYATQAAINLTKPLR